MNNEDNSSDDEDITTNNEIFISSINNNTMEIESINSDEDIETEESDTDDEEIPDLESIPRFHEVSNNFNRFMDVFMTENMMNTNYEFMVGDEMIAIELTEENVRMIKNNAKKRANELLSNALDVFEEKIDIDMYEKINKIYLNFVYSIYNSNNFSEIIDYIYISLHKEFYSFEEITEQVFGYSYYHDNYVFKDFEKLKTTVLDQLIKLFIHIEKNKFFRNIIDERYERNRVKLILPTEEIEKLDSCVYTNFSLEMQKNNKQCSICLDDFEMLSECKLLKCNHVFHSNCVTEWLSTYSHKCPVCRNESENYKANI